MTDVSSKARWVLRALSALGVAIAAASVTTPSAFASTPLTSTVPGAPRGVSATPGNASALIKWSAPSNDGGSAITGYTATAKPGSKTCTTTGTRSCTIHSLTNGTTYTVTVKARNAKGLGAASAGVTVKPALPPTITGFASSRSVVSTSNGTITLSARVAHATRCVFSVTSGGVSGLPHAEACTTGTVSDTVTLRYNYSASSARHVFELSVIGAGGRKDATVDVTVDSGDGSLDPSLNPVYGDPYNAIAAASGENYRTKDVTGNGFAPNEDVVLTVEGSQVGGGTTDDDGDLTATLTVPTVPDGPYELDGTGQTAGDVATTTLTVSWDLYYNSSDSCSSDVWTEGDNWEAHGLDANSYYTIALSNGQQFEVETDATGSFTTSQTLTIDGGTTQTFTFSGPLLGKQTTIYSWQVPYGSC